MHCQTKTAEIVRAEGADYMMQVKDTEDGAKNMALFRRALLNLIKAHPLKDSVAGKMM
jgi:hypothetical protein